MSRPATSPSTLMLPMRLFRSRAWHASLTFSDTRIFRTIPPGLAVRAVREELAAEGADPGELADLDESGPVGP